MINFEYLKGQLGQFKDKRLKAEITGHIEQRKKLAQTSLLAVGLMAFTVYKIRRGIATQMVLMPAYCAGLYLVTRRIAENDWKLLRLLENNAENIPIDFCVLLDDLYKF